jgi:hypothetical protein
VVLSPGPVYRADLSGQVDLSQHPRVRRIADVDRVQTGVVLVPLERVAGRGVVPDRDDTGLDERDVHVVTGALEETDLTRRTADVHDADPADLRTFAAAVPVARVGVVAAEGQVRATPVLDLCDDLHVLGLVRLRRRGLHSQRG